MSNIAYNERVVLGDGFYTGRYNTIQRLIRKLEILNQDSENDIKLLFKYTDRHFAEPYSLGILEKIKSTEKLITFYEQKDLFFGHFDFIVRGEQFDRLAEDTIIWYCTGEY